MYLPGTIPERIGDLRSRNKLSQKKLAELIDVAPSQISRIENGETQSISSDILVKLTKAFGVSSDYLLGLTTVSVPKSYDISELGLSEGAVRGLVTGAIDVQILNRLMEHKTFPYMLYLVKAYFDNSIADGIIARNEIIDMATAALGDFVKYNPDSKAEVQGSVKLLRSQKLTDHEAEIEKIKSAFTTILRDIKKGFEDGNAPKQSATVDFMQSMREQVKAIQQAQMPIGAEDIVSAMMNMIGDTAAFDEKSEDLFKQLAQNLLTGSNLEISKNNNLE